MPRTSQDVTDNQKRLKVAAAYAEKTFFPRADRMVSLYKVNHHFRNGTPAPDPDEAGTERVKVAYPYANARQILAEILPNDPRPLVRAMPEEYAADLLAGMEQADPTEAAQMMKGGIQYVTRKSNFRRELKMSLLDGIVTGLGIAQLVAQRTSMVPRYRRLLYRDALIDYGNVTDPYESDFVAVKEVKRLDLIRKDERFREGARQNVQSAKLDPAVYGETGSEVDYGVLWHLFDKRENLYLCFPDGQDFELSKTALTDYYDLPSQSDEFGCDYPFAFFANEEILDEAFGLGDLYPIESQVRELDRFRTRQLKHTRKFHRKYIVNKGTLTASGMNQLKSPEDGAVIEAAKDVDVTKAVYPLPDAPLSADQFRVEASVKEDLQVIQPVTPYSVSKGVGDRPDTLGEARIIEQSSNTRLGEKQRNVAEFTGRLFYLTAYYIRQYWTMEQRLLVSGDGSREQDFVDFDPLAVRQVRMEYDVAPESLRDNTQVYRQQLSTALATVAPLYPVIAMGQQPGVALVVRRYLETFETLEKDVDSIVPEDWTKPAQPTGMGMGMAPEDEELMNLVNGSDPDELIDSVNGLPEDQRNAITGRIQRLQQSQPVAPAR